MRRLITLFALLSIASVAGAGDEIYQFGDASVRQDDVPRGKVTEHVWRSQVFPDTIRRYWVYVPAQYEPSEPAAVMVFQDGHTYVDESGQFRAPVVLDNLIHSGELPVMIGVFIDPGHKTDQLPAQPGWEPRPANRSFEYDTLSDQYASFLVDEIIPEVGRNELLKQRARDTGRRIEPATRMRRPISRVSWTQI